MATKILRTSKRTVTLDARPDRPDLRDRLYQPPLVSLPHQYPPPEWIETYLPRYSKAGLILDQGEEGACTGFGLAAVINYLLFRQFVLGKTPSSPTVSTRMIYHLARKYDEWPGEDYEGSSCRGAMKGWFHHGVCSDKLWPYRDKNGDAKFVPPDPKWNADAAQRPLGAYYRIMKDSITDLQAAINEVGAVYVSSDVHRGWDSIANTTSAIPTIPWKTGTAPVGGHAFALVGYDASGFIVQNSWGEDWGFHGFARVTYDDWLTNGDDAWVAVMGAPIAACAPAIMLASLRTLSASDAHLGAGLANGATADVVAELARPNAWNTETAVNHTVILGNDGLPDHVTIEDADAAAAVERVCYELPKAWLKSPKNGGRRIAVYAHGGLNDLTASLERAKVMGPWFEQNGVYPVFVAWQSGVADTIENIIGDLIDDLVSGAQDRKTRSLVDTISEARDYLIEVAAIVPARPIWSQMKQNAVAASSGAGGMVTLATCLARLGQDYSNLGSSRPRELPRRAAPAGRGLAPGSRGSRRTARSSPAGPCRALGTNGSPATLGCPAGLPSRFRGGLRRPPGADLCRGGHRNPEDRLGLLPERPPLGEPVQAAVDPPRDRHEVPGLRQRVETVPGPEPCGRQAPWPRRRQELGVPHEVHADGRPARAIVVPARELDRPAAAVTPAVAAGFRSVPHATGVHAVRDALGLPVKRPGLRVRREVLRKDLAQALPAVVQVLGPPLELSGLVGELGREGGHPRRRVDLEAAHRDIEGVDDRIGHLRRERHHRLQVSSRQQPPPLLPAQPPAPALRQPEAVLRSRRCSSGC